MSRYEEKSITKVSTTLSVPLGTIGFITWLVFLILKLTNNPDWLTWFWVWFPFWLPWAIFGAELIILLVAVLIITALDR